MAKDVSRVLVIGAGVSGLTTALALSENGFEVEVLGERPAERTVSVIAGALWEFPPAVCGQHGNPLSIARSKSWCVASYQRFKRINDPEANGVRMVRAGFYFTEPVELDKVERRKLQELEKLHANGEIDDLRRLTVEELSTRAFKEFDIVDGYQLTVPAIDTPRYMVWLRQQVLAAGVLIHPTGQRVTGRLIPQEAALRARFRVDAIVNCTGMGAAELAGTAMVPLRGMLIQVPTSKLNRPIAHAHAIAKSPSKQDMIFVVPRGDSVMLGGLVEPGEYETIVDKTYPPIRDVYRRCQDFLEEELSGVDLDDDDIQVHVGLRPYRLENVCLEQEQGFNIVHNFGHGGSGFTFSWGCADEVTELIRGMDRR